MQYRAAASIVLWLLSAGAGMGCTIPVFRFALDRWEADKFHLVLPAAISQEPATQDLLRPFRANGTANLDIQTDPRTKQARLLFSREDAEEAWSGEFQTETFQSLLDSPARQQIVNRILAGDSVLWAFVDRGSAEDAQHIERIGKRLRFLEQAAALPLQDPNDPDSQLGPGPELKLKFSTLRIGAHDPSEALLVQMLAGPKGKDLIRHSFAAAIFGRGRVLGAWKLDELDDAPLEDACLFLIGRCSCRVKNENPGWDLLLNVDWESALRQAMAARPRDATPSAALVEPARAETITIQPRLAADPTVPPPATGSPGMLGMVASIAMLAASVCFAILGYRLLRSRSRP